MQAATGYEIASVKRAGRNHACTPHGRGEGELGRFRQAVDFVDQQGAALRAAHGLQDRATEQVRVGPDFTGSATTTAQNDQSSIAASTGRMQGARNQLPADTVFAGQQHMSVSSHHLVELPDPRFSELAAGGKIGAPIVLRWSGGRSADGTLDMIEEFGLLDWLDQVTERTALRRAHALLQVQQIGYGDD